MNGSERYFGTDALRKVLSPSHSIRYISFELYSPLDYDDFVAVWNSSNEMYLIEWDGDSTFRKASVPKYLSDPFMEGRVQLMPDGSPFVVQTYLPSDLENGYLVTMVKTCRP